MRRKKLTPLVLIVLAAVASMSWALGTDTSPELGLDLQGGVSVVLQPTKRASDDALKETESIIRRRVDALGVAEPDITRQGSSIVVQLPGVKNQQRALELVGDTAELRFRPVLSSIPGSAEGLPTTTTTAPPDGATTTPPSDGATTTVPADSTTSTAGDVEGQSLGAGATPFQDPTTTTTASDTTTTTTPPVGEPLTGYELTPPEEDVADQPVVLAEYDAANNILLTYRLGPSAATGRIVSTAAAELDPRGQWSVRLEIKGGSNIDSFNAIASECFNGTERCPSQQLAIVLDSRVVSAPTIQRASFDRDQIQITGSFAEKEAKDLALVLRYGSLPVNLEPQTVQTVSPTLGKDSLRAGLAAGLLGLALVCLYMILYYRALGLVVVLGLCVWGALNYAIISRIGVVLSLAGVTGIVVSVGVTVDSYVVYFERLKDELRAGRTLRTSTERSFSRAFRTILAADISSFIGASLLFLLTVGPVRGFAFFLGLSTILDVVVAWFFTRPIVGALSRNRLFTDARWFGVARGLDAPGLPAAATAGGAR